MMPPTLSQSQPLFSQKENSVYPIFDIFLDKLKCQIRPVAYHYFPLFRRGKYINALTYLKPPPKEKDIYKVLKYKRKMGFDDSIL